MIFVELTKEDCYKSLTSFYETVASKAGILYNESSVFDCRRINVTKSCVDVLITYMIENYQTDRETANMVMLMSGPKAYLSGDGYFAVTEVGFVKEG